MTSWHKVESLIDLVSLSILRCQSQFTHLQHQRQALQAQMMANRQQQGALREAIVSHYRTCAVFSRADFFQQRRQIAMLGHQGQKLEFELRQLNEQDAALQQQQEQVKARKLVLERKKTKHQRWVTLQKQLDRLRRGLSEESEIQERVVMSPIASSPSTKTTAVAANSHENQLADALDDALNKALAHAGRNHDTRLRRHPEKVPLLAAVMPPILQQPLPPSIGTTVFGPSHANGLALDRRSAVLSQGQTRNAMHSSKPHAQGSSVPSSQTIAVAQRGQAASYPTAGSTSARDSLASAAPQEASLVPLGVPYRPTASATVVADASQGASGSHGELLTASPGGAGAHGKLLTTPEGASVLHGERSVAQQGSLGAQQGNSLPSTPQYLSHARLLAAAPGLTPRSMAEQGSKDVAPRSLVPLAVSSPLDLPSVHSRDEHGVVDISALLSGPNAAAPAAPVSEQQTAAPSRPAVLLPQLPAVPPAGAETNTTSVTYQFRSWGDDRSVTLKESSSIAGAGSQWQLHPSDALVDQRLNEQLAQSGDSARWQLVSDQQHHSSRQQQQQQSQSEEEDQ